MTEKNIITPEMYHSLMTKLDEVTKENELFKQKSPLVGVRWFGLGGIGLGLNYAVNGTKRVSLEGYGDKGVIDVGTWFRVRGTEEVRGGILVRDDRVIEETATNGYAAKPDIKENPNAFVDDEIERILKMKSMNKLRQVMKNCTNHFCPKHFRMVGKEINCGLERLAIISERETYLY